MAMENIRQKMNQVFEGGRYASTEEELYDKAIALLDKCKIESPLQDGETPELESAARAT